jgi:serine/threonine protein kinase
LIDFGFAEKIPSGMLSSKRMGSKYNIAPEIFMNIPYDFKIDVWSATIIVFVLLCGHLPF